jgi:hypothetical protein
MNGIARLSLTGLLMVALAGCGAPPADEEEAEVAPDPDSQRAEKTVFDDMIQTEDRARAVEGVLMDSKRDLDTAIDHAEDDTAE